MKLNLAIVLFGGIGSISRYFLGRYVGTYWPRAFPLGTLLINLLGTALLGFLTVAALERGSISSEWRIMLGVGFCGGFTTFSSWMWDTYYLWSRGQGNVAVANLVISMMGGLLCVAAGAALARLVWRT